MQRKLSLVPRCGHTTQTYVWNCNVPTHYDDSINKDSQVASISYTIPHGARMCATQQWEGTHGQDFIKQAAQINFIPTPSSIGLTVNWHHCDQYFTKLSHYSKFLATMTYVHYLQRQWRCWATRSVNRMRTSDYSNCGINHRHWWPKRRESMRSTDVRDFETFIELLHSGRQWQPWAL